MNASYHKAIPHQNNSAVERMANFPRKCEICRSTRNVFSYVRDPRRSLCANCYAVLDVRVGIPYPSEAR